MPQYSSEEKKMFANKDHRISIQGVLQIILRLKGLEGLQCIEENVALAKRYSDEIWRAVDEVEEGEVADRSTTVTKQPETNVWVAAAAQAGTKPPTPQEQKILDVLYEKLPSTYCFGCTEQGVKAVLLQTIIENHSKYPSRMSSVEKVLKNLM